METATKERINIKSLVVEEPPRNDGLVLNDDLYLTVSDLPAVKKVVDAERWLSDRHHHTLRAYRIMAGIKYIGPTIFESIEIKPPEDMAPSSSYTPSERLEFYACVNLIFPGYKHKMPAEFMEKARTQDVIITMSFHNNLVLETVSLFPENIGKFTKDEKLWANLKDKVQKEFAGLDRIVAASEIKLLWPERVNALITEDLWEKITRYYLFTKTDLYRIDRLEEFCKSVRAMMILAADEVTIDNNGLRIVMTKEPEQTFALPQHRRF
ncbi:hypothetical protein A3A60_01630 [Candidatus Curtissbacteria bacterium RIFCSPLOWO2_01_FULL_42_26]|uniref:Uncharacterized protein n=1 Tax=Candidatus Curtissbacteria bacterium RIFCSPLOWO2_01_FULL_42_26 TaxID=1797729 RepID=A0A1F5HZT5_9BACT|nr:MAG: hypothetical protein A3A60_01630 [Candidatus Curtissbacteria bacterium RIFCSPLOWO2_01_FULL_42_26]